LAKGAEVNSRDDIGNTPLHYAAFTGKKAMVELLLKNKADATITNQAGQTALAMTDERQWYGYNDFGIPYRTGLAALPPRGPRTVTLEQAAVADLLRQQGAKE
jgi:hypothetical protein